ncbi:hypothetical protein BV22DRAFT_981015, partial [Leucogyrophana mollusca]
MPDMHHQPPGAYMPYPSMQYGFHDPGGQYSQPPLLPQSLFPSLGLPLPDFQFGSNDEILRAIQDLDVSKIASV